LTTNPSTDAAVVGALNDFMKKNNSYNGLTCNCSDFAKEGVIYGELPNTPAPNYQEKIGSNLSTTPNQLWKAAAQLKNKIILKAPGTKVQKAFIDGVTTSAIQKIAAKAKVN
jgi:hypothetical protein